jgi:hypothetical protein
MTLDATGSACQLDIEVSTGSDVAARHEVWTASNVSRFPARRGTTYNVRLACASPNAGDYVLDLSDGSIQGKGITMDVAKGQTVRSVRSHGLQLSIATRRTASVTLDVMVSKPVMRRLGLSSRVLGHTSGTLEPGEQLPAGVMLSKAARRALAGRDHLDATVRLALRSQAPNRVMDVPVSLPN